MKIRPCKTSRDNAWYIKKGGGFSFETRDRRDSRRPRAVSSFARTLNKKVSDRFV